MDDDFGWLEAMFRTRSKVRASLLGAKGIATNGAIGRY